MFCNLRLPPYSVLIGIIQQITQQQLPLLLTVAVVSRLFSDQWVGKCSDATGAPDTDFEVH